MIKKTISSLAFIFFAVAATAQSYYLPTPEGWEPETFSFPIEFAPNIPFSGQEEVRFTPGWGNTASEELWSYCFVWWINGDSKIDAPSLKKYLEEYYNGLVSRNIIKRKIDSAKVVPTVATVLESGQKPSHEFTASVDMLDYMSVRPVKLNIKVHVKDCLVEGKKAVFFSISPQPLSHRIWKQFAEVKEGFKCVK